MTDLGTLGLTGSGFEVAAPDVAGLGGFVGTTADAAAVSTGDPVTQVGPETSLQYEGSVRYRRPRFRTELSLFVNNVYDNIQKQALILPQGAVGTTLGGTPITSQNANGAVFVAATTVPVLVRANFDNARIWGIEHSAEARVADTVTVATAFTYLRAKDTGTGSVPQHRRRNTRARRLVLRAMDAAGRTRVGRALPARRLGADPPVVARSRRPAHRLRPDADEHPGVLPERRARQRLDRPRRRQRLRHRRRSADRHGRNAGADPGPRARRGRQLVVALPDDSRLRDVRRARVACAPGATR